MEKLLQQRTTELPLGEIKTSKAGKQYMELLFQLNPDSELLARMWEENPVIMNGLMPEVGIREPQPVPTARQYLQTAINGIRRALGREERELKTPEQRMYEAWLSLTEEEKAISYEPTHHLEDWESQAMHDEPRTYFAVAKYVARQQVASELDD